MDQQNKSTPTRIYTGDIVKQNPKRKFNETSPENMEKPDEVGKMSANELINLMSSVLDEKLKDMATKNDVKEVKEDMREVKSEVTRLADENKVLHEEVLKLKEERENDQKRMKQLEDGLGKKKIIIRGLASQRSTYEAVKKMIKENLKIENRIEIEQTKKIFERNGKMTVLVELRSEAMVSEIFKYTKNLRGTSIYVERDLSNERQKNKKIMIQLRKEILHVDKSKRVAVRDDKLVVDDKRFFWDKNNVLRCGQSTGEEVLKDLYGEKALSITLDYNEIFAKTNSKN